MKQIRVTCAALILVLVGGLLTACGRTEPAPAIPPGARAGDLTLEPCTVKTDFGGYAADCGTLLVAEGQNASASRLISLPVRRFRSTAQDPAEPIFWLVGGPAQSNLDFEPPPELLAKHDVVLVGYRGVDGPTALHCPEVGQAAKGVGDDVLSPESIAHLGEAFAQCAARKRAEGFDLDAYTMMDVIRDLEVARAAMGYERVNLLSESYGTRVALLYAYQHPDRIHRSALVGVNPPGRFVWEPEMVDRHIEDFARLCADDPHCRARTPDLVQTIRNVSRNMPRRWLFLPIDPGKVRVVTFVQLFQRQSAAEVFDAFIAAEQGDPSGLAFMTLAYDLIMTSWPVWGDTPAKAVSADLDPSRDYVVDMDPPGSILGSPYSKQGWGAAPYWPIKPIPAAFRQVQRSDVEMLLVSGSLDISTPPENVTNDLMPHLTRARHVILKEFAHTNDLLGFQPQATNHMLSTFFATGVADDSRFTYVPMEFQVAWGYPRLIKVALGVGVLLVSGVVGLAWFVIRRLRRRRAHRVIEHGIGG